MTKLDELRRACAEAASGEMWRRVLDCVYCEEEFIAECESVRDAEMIVALHNAFPRILAVLEAAEECNRPMAWSGGDVEYARLCAAWRAFEEGGE